jgi:hypothetical protein
MSIPAIIKNYVAGILSFDSLSETASPMSFMGA